MDILTENQQKFQCDVLTDIGQTIEAAVDIVTQNQHTMQCGVLKDSGQTVEDSIGHSDTESADDTL